MFDTPPRHRSHLLTVWAERSRDPNSPVAWRFSLEDPRTGQRRGCADLAALVAALQDELSDAEAAEQESRVGPAR